MSNKTTMLTINGVGKAVVITINGVDHKFEGDVLTTPAAQAKMFIDALVKKEELF